jgi:hypothetical protein
MAQLMRLEVKGLPGHLNSTLWHVHCTLCILSFCTRRTWARLGLDGTRRCLPSPERTKNGSLVDAASSGIELEYMYSTCRHSACQPKPALERLRIKYLGTWVLTHTGQGQGGREQGTKYGGTWTASGHGGGFEDAFESFPGFRQGRKWPGG